MSENCLKWNERENQTGAGRKRCNSENIQKGYIDKKSKNNTVNRINNSLMFSSAGQRNAE